MLKSNIFGIELAKTVLQVCQISQHGELVMNKAVKRQKLKELLSNAKQSIVAIEDVLVAIIGGDTLNNLVIRSG